VRESLLNSASALRPRSLNPASGVLILKRIGSVAGLGMSVYGAHGSWFETRHVGQGSRRVGGRAGAAYVAGWLLI